MKSRPLKSVIGRYKRDQDRTNKTTRRFTGHYKVFLVETVNSYRSRVSYVRVNPLLSIY